MQEDKNNRKDRKLKTEDDTDGKYMREKECVRILATNGVGAAKYPVPDSCVDITKDWRETTGSARNTD